MKRLSEYYIRLFHLTNFFKMCSITEHICAYEVSFVGSDKSLMYLINNWMLILVCVQGRNFGDLKLVSR